MMENENIDQLFRDSFDNFQVEPPVEVKTLIDSKIKFASSKRKGFYLWSLVVFLFIGGFISLMILGINTNANRTLAKTNENKFSNSSQTQSSQIKNGDKNSFSENITKTQKSSKTNAKIKDTKNKVYNKSDNTTDKKENNSTITASNKVKSSSAENKENNDKPKFENKPILRANKLKSPKKVAKKSQNVTLSSSENNSIDAQNKSASNEQISKSNSTKTENSDNLKESAVKSQNENASTNSNVSVDASQLLTSNKQNSKSNSPKKENTDLSKEAVETPQNENLSNSQNTSFDAKNILISDEKAPNSTKTENKDTLVTEDKTTTSADSSMNSTGNDIIDEQAAKKDANPKNWYVQAQFGGLFGVNSSYKSTNQESAKTTSKLGLGIDLGISRKLNLGNWKYVGITGGYSNYKNAIQDISNTETSYTINDSIPIYDSLNTVIGYQPTSHDTTIVGSSTTNYQATVSQFAIGLSTEFDFQLKGSLGLSITPSIRYAFTKYAYKDNSSFNYTSQQVQFRLGIDLYYDWKQWRFMIGCNSRYQLNIKNPSQIIGERNRIQFLPQIGIGFRF